eukprot:5398378-Pleurochrysis_carterae.AAC.1
MTITVSSRTPIGTTRPEDEPTICSGLGLYSPSLAAWLHSNKRSLEGSAVSSLQSFTALCSYWPCTAELLASTSSSPHSTSACVPGQAKVCTAEGTAWLVPLSPSPPNSTSVFVCMYAYVCLGVFGCVRASERACVRACVRAC